MGYLDSSGLARFKSKLDVLFNSKLSSTLKGSANGLAELNSSGKVPENQLPSYVDDVVEYSSFEDLPASGETGKIYVTTNTNETYRWSGTTYVAVGGGVALGETSETAYRGDRGKAAYDHASENGKVTTPVTAGLYKVSVTGEGHIGSADAVTKADIELLGIPGADTWRGIQDNLTSEGNTTDSLSANQGFLLANGAARDNSKRSDDAPEVLNWFKGTPRVDSQGGMEVGKQIDFHATDDSELDYSARISADNTGFTLTGTTKGTFSGDLTGDVTGDLTGNADTATQLETPRSINGTNFDGTSNITTNKWGTTRTITIEDSDSTNAGTAVNVDGSANVTLPLPSTIKASLTGNVTGNVTGNLSGNASTSTKWAAAQTVYVALGTASTTTTIQGGSNSAVALGVNGTLAIGNGGTGATTAANARNNLGLGSIATYGAATAGTQDTWGLVPVIGASDGVMEIGKYIDFHVTDGNTKDYDVRITANTSGLSISGTTSGTFSGNLTGNVTGNVSGSSGSCTGNAATATKATQDGSGNVITSKYVTVDTAQTITGTKSWGTSGAGGQLNGSATNGGINSIRIGDDVWLGDCNAGGIMGMKSTGANTGFYFYNSSGTQTGQLYADGAYLVTNKGLRFATANGIYYTGSKATYQMIGFVDNTGDTYGNGIRIGGGGLTVLGSGESSNTLLSNLSLTSSGGSETTYITSDSSIEFYPSINSWDATARIWMTAGVLNIGLDGNSSRENSLNVYGGAGRIQLYSAASTTGNRGLWIPAHGSGSAKNIILVDTNNNVTFNGNVTGNCSGSAGSVAWANTGHPSTFPPSDHNHGTLHNDFTVSLANTTTDSGWSMINSSYSGFLLKSIRFNSSSPAWGVGNYGAGICFGGYDTKGIISCAYGSPSIKIAGGNGTKPVWYIGLTGTTAKTYDLNAPVTNITRSGTTFTATRANGTTFTFTQQDNDTNTWRGIQNNLTSTSTTDSLSAAQGKALYDKLKACTLLKTMTSASQTTVANWGAYMFITVVVDGYNNRLIRTFPTAALTNGKTIWFWEQIESTNYCLSFTLVSMSGNTATVKAPWWGSSVQSVLIYGSVAI